MSRAPARIMPAFAINLERRPRPRRRHGPCRARPQPRAKSCRRAMSECQPRHACRAYLQGCFGTAENNVCRPWRSAPRPSRHETRLTRLQRPVMPEGPSQSYLFRFGIDASDAEADQAPADQHAASLLPCVISFSFAISTAIFRAASVVRFPERVCSMNSFATLHGEFQYPAYRDSASRGSSAHPTKLLEHGGITSSSQEECFVPHLYACTRQRLRRADTRNHIFALRVDQIFAVEIILTR
jgi:hypothetical protein